MAEWLIEQKIAVARIPDEQFDELKEYAMDALEKGEPLEDHPYYSINTEDGSNAENIMPIPPKFSTWLLKEIHTLFERHKAEGGIYGIDDTTMQIAKMWVNRMKKGDQHQLHCHTFSMYSFSSYLDVQDNDAPFIFVNGDHVEPVYINDNSNKHLLIFPSTLMHTVYRKKTDGERITASGNVVLNPFGVAVKP